MSSSSSSDGSTTSDHAPPPLKNEAEGGHETRKAVARKQSSDSDSSSSDEDSRPQVHRKVMGRPGSATNSQRPGSAASSAGGNTRAAVTVVIGRPSSGRQTSSNNDTAPCDDQGGPAPMANEANRTVDPPAATREVDETAEAEEGSSAEQRAGENGICGVSGEGATETQEETQPLAGSTENAVTQPSERSANAGDRGAEEAVTTPIPEPTATSVAPESPSAPTAAEATAETAEGHEEEEDCVVHRTASPPADPLPAGEPTPTPVVLQQDAPTVEHAQEPLQEGATAEGAVGSGYENDEYEDEFEELSPVKESAAAAAAAAPASTEAETRSPLAVEPKAGESTDGLQSSQLGDGADDAGVGSATDDTEMGKCSEPYEAVVVAAETSKTAREDEPPTADRSSKPTSPRSASSSSASASSSSSSSYHPIDSSPERIASIRHEVELANSLRRESLNASSSSAPGPIAGAVVVPLEERLKQVTGAQRPESRDGRRGAPGRQAVKPPSEARMTQGHRAKKRESSKPTTTNRSESTEDTTPNSNRTPRVITTDTPIRVDENDTVASVFLRSTHDPSTRGSSRPGRSEEGKGSRSLADLSGKSVVHIDNLRRWISPYECPVNHHPRLVLRDVQELEEQRRHEAHEHKMTVEQRKAEEAKRLREEDEARHRLKVSATSPRLCKPRHQHAPVGAYATSSPRPPPPSSVSPSDSSSRRASTAVGGTKSEKKKRDAPNILPTMASLYASGDMPHYMLPRPPPREPRPISFQPDTQQFRRNGPLHSDEDDDNDGVGGVGGPAVLSEEEFALRFFTQQLEQRKNALNKSFLKFTGAPMPEVVPRKVTSPRRLNRTGEDKRGGRGEEEHDGTGNEAHGDDEEDDEANDARDEFEREIGRKFHDEEVASRAHRKVLLYAKYGIAPPPSSTQTTHYHSHKAHSVAAMNASSSQVTDAGEQSTRSSRAARVSPNSRGPSSPPLSHREARIVHHAYVEAVAQQRAAQAALWSAMEKQTYNESVHRRVDKMTKEKWTELLSRNLK